MNAASKAPNRRACLIRLSTLVLVACTSFASVFAQSTDRYQVIQKVEVFTHMDVPIRSPKTPPFELKVYRLDGFRKSTEALDRLTPKGLFFPEKRDWQKQYIETHPEFNLQWVDVAAESLVGMQAFRRYQSRGFVPVIVINGSWVLNGESDVDKAIKAYRQQERN
ncbi:hypothetical protein LPB72_10240 [Hydrogenophaga crassostreae]|uniref:Integrating conjugative element protein n=1 Tax=Hydrogenophaga crassostreae TaxID=1763535 RepID=A0A167HSW5_9BURK|nr:DUF1525 domain-containing protein [Hydrogenophaga crassostreae]AOW13405.1 hypothetical protein LPB072_11620 [Hydrogenophaga crassostreae]OAD41690.1 hypothetical protein LPB72_10240 [Hydrogenophaga crassostreae]